jgi:hypothetical protein
MKVVQPVLMVRARGLVGLNLHAGTELGYGQLLIGIKER